MRLVAFDLDDTLMTCGHDYDETKDRFASFMANEYGVDPERTKTLLDEFEHETVDEFGLLMKSYPRSMVKTYNHLAESPTDEHREHVEEIGYSVFKTEEEYRERGFIPGAKQILEHLRDHDFDLHLITAGDERVQNRKIRGLGLDEYFMDTHVTPINGKDDKLAELMEEHNYSADETFLVGNSLSSDIKAALNVGARGVYIPAAEWRPTDNREYYETHNRVHISESLEHVLNESPDLFMTPPSKVGLAD